MSISTTQSLPSRTYPCAARTASCALRPGRNPQLDSLNSGSKIGCNTCSKACCSSRSITVGMPNCRLSPFGLGISTRRTGLGVQRPAKSFARIFSPWRRKWDSSCAVVMPSMPAAPWLRFTAANARRRFSSAATCSIRSSCLTFCREFRGSRSGSHRHWPATVPPLLPPPAPRLVPPTGKDLAARDSGKPPARCASRSSSFAPWSFRPLLQRR